MSTRCFPARSDGSRCGQMCQKPSPYLMSHFPLSFSPPPSLLLRGPILRHIFSRSCAQWLHMHLFRTRHTSFNKSKSHLENNTADVVRSFVDEGQGSHLQPQLLLHFGRILVLSCTTCSNSKAYGLTLSEFQAPCRPTFRGCFESNADITWVWYGCVESLAALLTTRAHTRTKRETREQIYKHERIKIHSRCVTRCCR